NRQKPNRPIDDIEANALLSGLTQNTPEAQFITRGDRGVLAGQHTVHHSIPGIAITGPVDPVGAGDASTAMLAACGAIQLDQRSSAILANLSASVTVRKLNQTGTASETELLDAARHLAYVYHPSLADDLRLAKTFGDSDIEIVDDSMVPVISPESFPFKYAIFDHDGTISTLRQGWETVMESVMVRAITGNRFQSVERSILQLVTGRVHEYIEQTTGIQTIAQMDGLVLLVHEFGLVSDNEKLDAWGYKRLYNDALMAMINERIARLRRKELDHDDFIIKGAVEFLQTLCDAAVSLLLFSGTDEADVMREAELLGYAKYFDGGIYGAKPNSRADTKDEILTSLLTSQVGTQIDAATLGGKVLVIGDGPVELQLARRYGAVALGIASNEQRRFGLNPSKRRRLIRAGAHILTPDFSQARVLCDAVRQFRLGAPVDPPRL
ncbi:MAG TPA: PfkB family carbohydrate kinase, partial [Anaerolineae bacterium]